MPGVTDWDVAELTRTHIDDRWTTVSSYDKPDVVRLRTEDENGDPTKGIDPAGQEYVIVAETDVRDESYVDGPRDVVDQSAAAFVEAATYKSRSRRDEMWSALLALARDGRKRRENTPGDWDTVAVDANSVPDDAFNYWSLQMTFRYEAEARTI